MTIKLENVTLKDVSGTINADITVDLLAKFIEDNNIDIFELLKALGYFGVRLFTKNDITMLREFDKVPDCDKQAVIDRTMKYADSRLTNCDDEDWNIIASGIKEAIKFLDAESENANAKPGNYQTGAKNTAKSTEDETAASDNVTNYIQQCVNKIRKESIIYDVIKEEADHFCKVWTVSALHSSPAITYTSIYAPQKAITYNFELHRLWLTLGDEILCKMQIDCDSLEIKHFEPCNGNEAFSEFHRMEALLEDARKKLGGVQ